jgi:hypothetical protein
MQSKDDTLRAMVISASMAAMGLVLPIAFHAVGLGGKFLPMLLPLLLNGFLAPLPWAISTGALVPLLSAVITGMPPLFPPVAFSMSLECAVLAGTAAALYRGRPSRLWYALIAAILLGRSTSLGATWALAQLLHLPAAVVTGAVLAQGLPGVLLQLAVVPLVVRQTARRRGLLFNHDAQSQTDLLQ